MTDSQRWFIILGILLFGGLVYLLSPVLAPFLIAALLAYFLNPLVNKLANWHIPRVLAVSLVFILFLLIVLCFFIILVPVLEHQITVLLGHMPAINKWLTTVAWPWINIHFHIQEKFTLTNIENTILKHLKESGGVLANVWSTITHSGQAIIGFIVNLIIVLVVCFYLLVDWVRITHSAGFLLPRRVEQKTTEMIKECGNVLAAFFRGQLLVMIGLGIIYAAGLWMIGLDVGILIGFIAGLLSIVPYLGFIGGILLATIAALIQFPGWIHLVWVLIVFAIGSVAESFILVPWLVGDRVGLHPVAVIFAILAGGQLFGFVGVLLAVPAAAVIMVFLRHLHGQYIGSKYHD